MAEEMLDPPGFTDNGHEVTVTLPLRSTVAPAERAWLRELEHRGTLAGPDRIASVHAARWRRPRPMPVCVGCWAWTGRRRPTCLAAYAMRGSSSSAVNGAERPTACQALTASAGWAAAERHRPARPRGGPRGDRTDCQCRRPRCHWSRSRGDAGAVGAVAGGRALGADRQSSRHAIPPRLIEPGFCGFRPVGAPPDLALQSQRQPPSVGLRNRRSQVRILSGALGLLAVLPRPPALEVPPTRRSRGTPDLALGRARLAVCDTGALPGRGAHRALRLGALPPECPGRPVG